MRPLGIVLVSENVSVQRENRIALCRSDRIMHVSDTPSPRGPNLFLSNHLAFQRLGLMHVRAGSSFCRCPSLLGSSRGSHAISRGDSSGGVRASSAGSMMPLIDRSTRRHQLQETTSPVPIASQRRGSSDLMSGTRSWYWASSLAMLRVRVAMHGAAIAHASTSVVPCPVLT
eukprot:3008818-Rhodomonas_salina.1